MPFELTGPLQQKEKRSIFSPLGGGGEALLPHPPSPSSLSNCRAKTQLKLV